MIYAWDSQILSANCNVYSSRDTISSYSNGNRTRRTYIREGDKWILYQTSTNNNGYSIDGLNCIDVRTLEYKPEIDVYFQVISFGMIAIALYLIFKILFRFIRK